MLWAILGILVILISLEDAFETIILPRSVVRRLQLTGLFYDLTWRIYHPIIVRMKNRRPRPWLLAAYPPLTVILLIIMWASLLVLGFALVQYGFQVPFSQSEAPAFGDTLYFSGVTLFTLGYGDMIPISGFGKTVAVLESACGFGFLALIIGFVPVLYSAFSRREHTILQLDTRAGSDPSAYELLKRYTSAGVLPELQTLLKDWEDLSSILLENYLSFPVLAYYRSQHEHQSWLRSLVAIMDTCAFIESGLRDDEPWMRGLHFQARNTFAMARHLLVDLAYLLNAKPASGPARLSVEDHRQMYESLKAMGMPLKPCEHCNSRLGEIGEMYEPFARSLAYEIILHMPDWIPPEGLVDNWQTSAWEGVRHF